MNEHPEKPSLGHSVKTDPTSQVASPNKAKKYLTVIVLAVFAALLGRNFFTAEQNKKSQEAQITPAAGANIQAPQLNLDISPAEYAARLPVLPVKPLPLPPPPPSVLPEPINPMNDARLKSPTMVYGAKKAEAGRASTAAGEGNSGFLQQAAGAQVVSVSAKRNTNTHYKILQGKLLSAVLETAVDSDLPGMVRAVINKDIYSDTGDVVLLPKGTRLIGQYSSSIAIGQTRVIIAWTRAITPQYVDIALGSPGTDQLGQAGMTGEVDTHFWKVFGTSALLSVLGVAASSVNTGSNPNQLTGNPYQAAVSQGVLNTSNTVLQSKTDIQPTIRVAQGALIQVFVARDLDFSAVFRQRKS